MKLFVFLFLIYAGYRLIIPKNEEVQIEDKSNKKLSDDDYVDYEEVD